MPSLRHIRFHTKKMFLSLVLHGKATRLPLLLPFVGFKGLKSVLLVERSPRTVGPSPLQNRFPSRMPSNLHACYIPLPNSISLTNENDQGSEEYVRFTGGSFV